MERWTETKTAGGPGTGGGERGARRARAVRRGGRGAAVLVTAVVLAWLASGAGGCGPTAPDFRALCDWSCTCKGGDFCGQSNLDQCERIVSREQQVSEQVGCGQDFDAYVTCMSGATCGPGGADCQEEQKAYETCAAVDPAQCLPAMDKLAPLVDECGGSGNAVYAMPCTVWTRVLLACWVSCREEGSCEAVVGSDPVERAKYAACSEACIDASVVE